MSKDSKDKDRIEFPEFITPAQLTADVVPPSEQEFWVWLGSYPDSPVRCPTYGGLTWYAFNMVPRRINETTTSMSHGVPCMGFIYRMTRGKMRYVADCVRRAVYRFLLDVDGNKRTHQTGAHMVMPIRIPRPEDIERLKRGDHPYTPYRPQGGDEPVANYLYAQVLAEVNPRLRSIDEPMPEPLSKTGWQIPGPDATPIGITERLLMPHGHSEAPLKDPFSGWKRPPELLDVADVADVEILRP